MLVEAVGGSRRDALVALRDLLAARLDDGVDNPAPVAKQLREVLAELDSLSEPEESTLDDLAKKRQQRRNVPAGTEGGVKRRSRSS